jgi:1-acyl-sn-glycerol-3-phosphate acyltransferase
MASTPETADAADAAPAVTAAPPHSKLVWWGVWTAGWIVTRPYRLTATGIEHVPRTGAMVLASTHRSNLDTFVVGVPIPFQKLRPMAKIELFDNPVLAFVIGRGGGFPVRRGERDQQALDTAVAILREGGVISMFPEGTRSAEGGRAHIGAAQLALMTGAALVPVAVSGTDQIRFWPPRFPRFRAAYGPPIEVDDLLERYDVTDASDLRRAARDATERWKVAIAALRAEVARG